MTSVVLSAANFWGLNGMPSWVYIALGAVMVVAGLYIIINPKAFLRWGRGRASGKEPDKSALMAARFVGLAVIAMVVIGYLSMNQV